VSSANWKYDTGPGSSFGTGEIETMTNSTSNVFLDGSGHLMIKAIKSGSSWTSWRLLRPESGVALAERHEPRAPFAFMHHTWTYRALGPNRTSMTWTMRFGLPAPTEEQDRACSAYLLSSTERNQARMKAYIEDTYRKGNGS